MSKHSLSMRERQLIEGAAAGQTDAQIALRLGVSTGTVATYWVRIRAKYGGCSRTELVAMALKETFEARVHELEDNTAHLVSQLMHSSGEIAEHVNLYEAIFESAPEAILILSQAGVIEFLNAAACELLGYARKELEGQPVSVLVPHRHRLAHAQHVADFVAHPMKRMMADHQPSPALQKSGNEVQIRASLSHIEVAGVEIITCFLHPASA